MQLITPNPPYKQTANEFKGTLDKSRAHCLQPEQCKSALDSIIQWPGYQSTPLRKLPGLAKASGIGKIFVKDEASRFGLGSFKALGGAYAVSKLLQNQLREELGRDVSVEDLATGKHKELTCQRVVSCATDGNHGRSVAWGAQRFGCQCVIYIHAEVSEGRKSAIEHYGATVIRVDGNYDDSVRIAAAEAEKNNRTIVSDTSYEGYLDIPADVMRGYTVLADEALDQMGDELPTHVFLQGGVGGFAASITARIRDRCDVLQPRIVIVEPELAACIHDSVEAGKPVSVEGKLNTIMAGLACGEVSLIAFDVLLQEIDDVLVINDEAACATMTILAAGLNGDKPLVSGESGVTGLSGAIVASQNSSLAKKLDLDNNSVILVISTEGATDPDVYREIVGQDAKVIDTDWAGGHI